MRQQSVKKLRRLAKKIKPWVVYSSPKYHVAGYTSITKQPIYFIDPIKMLEACGRKFFKQSKKEYMENSLQ